MALNWKAMYLAPPPNRCHVTNCRDVLSLKKVCCNFLKILMDQKLLHGEAALLSRIIYRMKTKFRHDKGFQSMEKVNRCLLQYLRLNLASVYGNFTSCIRASFEAGMPLERSRTAVAPSKQMLEFLLLRTLGFIKLLSKAIQYCEEAAIYLKNRMYIGHSWNYALVAVCLISRIWCLTKYLVLSACDHYKSIVPFVDKLEYIGQPWKCSEMGFPVDIDSWLNVWWINGKLLKKTKKRQVDSNTTYLDKLFHDISGQSASEVEITETVSLSQFSIMNTDADLGEPVERKVIRTRPGDRNPKPKDTDSEHFSSMEGKRNPFGTVKSSKDLVKFMKTEEKMRAEDSDSAITKGMDRLQFNILTKKIHKFIKKLKELEDQKDSDEFRLALRKCKKTLSLYIH